MFKFTKKDKPTLTATVVSENSSVAVLQTKDISSDNTCFCTGTSAVEDSYTPIEYFCPRCGAKLNFTGKRFEEVEEEVEENDDEEIRPTVVNYKEVNKDLLEFPIFYNIVYGIPADLSFGSETAKRLNEYYNLEELKDEYYFVYPEKGEVIWINNLFLFLIADKKYEPITLETLENCLKKLAKDCVYERIKYLAMPRIGCGKGKLNWEDVRSMIIKIFTETILDECSDGSYTINIDFCYQ